MAVPVFDQVLIGGRWVPADGGTYPVVNPATEEPAGQAPAGSVAQAEAAARAARAAFEHGPWRTMSGAERARLLRIAAERFQAEIDGLVELTIAETGAVRGVAEAQQVRAVAARLLRAAELATAPVEQGLPPREAGRAVAAGVIVREPVGVVACGNTVVVKPAPVDPLGVAELCRIVDAVLPPGVLNFVNGGGPEIGEALVRSPDVDMISFTGSTAVGRRVKEAAAARMKRTVLELGGKSPNIVFGDCDFEGALASALSVWTFHSGQICIAGTRVLIEESLYDTFTRRLAAAGPTLRIGDPREPGVVVGPLVSAAQRTRVERFITRGREEGATVACGGRRPSHLTRGYYVEPTLFTGARNDMTIAREEIFGPVITAIPFRDEAEAIALANDSDYGLYGYVWTGDAARGLRVARAVRTGTMQINGSPLNPDAPFGGYKLSGVGRVGGQWALGAYSELKYIGWMT